MIEVSKDETVEAIIALDRAVFPFNLNGSRFFGTAGENSDWDFYCGDNEDIEEWLQISQFKPIPVHDPKEGDGYGYNRKHFNPPDFFPKVKKDAIRQDVVKVYRRGKVDVQMVTDPKVRGELISWIKDKMSCYRIINKSYHKVVYNFFFDVIYGNIKDDLKYAEDVVNFVFLSKYRKIAIRQFSAFVGRFGK